ncbi:MAG: hypothetical protein KAT53_01380 [Dehalococcoidia bacterium]|nr:hypothetical protein [Dehalococcoidia bacterium]
MRKLSKRQKGVLKAWFDENDGVAGGGRGGVITIFVDASILPLEVYRKVVAMGDHETIHQNMTRYLSDLASEA